MRLLPRMSGARDYISGESEAKSPEEVAYRGLTVATMLLILASLWAF